MNSAHLIGQLARKNNRSRLQKEQSVYETLLERLFPEQRDLVTDKSRFKSARCPRRAGKTYAMAIALITTCLRIPRANCLYLTLTRGQANKNIWGPIKEICKEFDLGVNFHNTNLTATFPDNSAIQLSGAETSQEIDKLRGASYDLVVIDEGKSFSLSVMRELIDEILRPALNDRLGSLILIGTPGNVLSGYFYEATTESSKGVRTWEKRKEHSGKYRWSFHKWHLRHNIALPHLWDAALSDKESNGWSDNDPRWIREYLGEWCASDDVRVYAYDGERNAWYPEGVTKSNPHGLPGDHQWKFLLGLDLGFEDDTAIVVSAYSETCPYLYHVWDTKSPHMTVPDIAKEVKRAQERFGEFEVMVADTGGLGKMIIETLGYQYGLHFEPADKKQKHDHIELLNSDLINQKVWINPDSYLASEMELLQWSTSEKKKEDPTLPNHACDAFLYQWRYAMHHFWEQPELQIEYGTDQWYEEQERKELERIVEKRRNGDNVLDQFGSDFELDLTLDY